MEQQLDLDVLKRSFSLLEQIHKDLDYLGVNLQYLLGGPLCVSDCGLCCQQSFVMPLISAQYIVFNIKNQPEPKQALLTERLEKWMLYDVPGVRSRFSVDGQNEIATRDREYAAVAKLWCPFLDDHKKCLIYPWRDTTCRAWGITRPSAKICHRPVYSGEDENTRLFIGSDEALVKGIRHNISMLRGLLADYQPFSLQVGWMPALVYGLLEPPQLAEVQTRAQQIKTSAFKTAYMWLLTLEDVSANAEKELFSVEQSIPVC